MNEILKNKYRFSKKHKNVLKVNRVNLGLVHQLRKPRKMRNIEKYIPTLFLRETSRVMERSGLCDR